MESILRNKTASRIRLHNTDKTGGKGNKNYTTGEQKIMLDFLKKYAAFKNINLSSEEILKQLIKDKIIEIKRVRNFLIVSEYYQRLSQAGNYSIKIINDLSLEYGMSSRQVQNVIYKWQGRPSK
jgi:hypothetical protein